VLGRNIEGSHIEIGELGREIGELVREFEGCHL
jgi:hypothetical protein